MDFERLMTLFPTYFTEFAKLSLYRAKIFKQSLRKVQLLKGVKPESSFWEKSFKEAG